MTVTTEALIQRDSLLIVWELRAVWATIFIYFLSSVCYMAWLFLPGSATGKSGSRLLLGGALIQTATIILRMVESGQPPYQTLYESLLWFAWSTVATYIFMERRFKGIHAGGFPVAVIACGACLYAVLGRSPGVTPLFPALQSDWFIWHVVIVFMSYAVFVVAFSVEFGYVIVARLLPPHMLSRYQMDAEAAARFHRAAHQLVLFGFPLLTFGIISGAAWAEQAWGRYWSWDPKETWSLITWTVYALYLHAMTMGKWRGGRASALNVLGFVCMFMTFLGVSWIAKLLGIPSIHAYSV
jgi:cytochrome c-type biogenesis protein CcsB